MRDALHWIWLPMRRYAEFSGRSRRREFWFFTIAVALLGAGFDYLDESFGLTFDQAGWVFGASGLLGAIFSLATLVPSLVVSIRRAHDTDLRGWRLLPPLAVVSASGLVLGSMPDVTIESSDQERMLIAATLAFLVALCVLLVLMARDGTEGPNRFGNDPKVFVDYEGIFD